jgi:hypothetical protein
MRGTQASIYSVERMGEVGPSWRFVVSLNDYSLQFGPITYQKLRRIKFSTLVSVFSTTSQYLASQYVSMTGRTPYTSC